MMCDNCKDRDAVVQVTQVVEGGNVHLHLCEKCAAERGFDPMVTGPKQPVADFIMAVQKQLPAMLADSSRCTFCSGTLRDFRATGRLGCAQCYTAFEATLRDLLRRVHGSAQHAGRVYEPPEMETPEGASVLSELRQRLRRAVDSEQFELAAKLRDQIRVLE